MKSPFKEKNTTSSSGCVKNQIAAEENGINVNFVCTPHVGT